MKQVLTIILALMFAGPVQAKLVTQTVAYQQDGTVFEGYLAYDDLSRARRPGVLVVHEWWGLNDCKERPGSWRPGYGPGRGRTARAVTRSQEAAKWSGELKGKPRLYRAQAALKVLADNPLVDPRRLAAIGFCFGGTTVLELAYSGANLMGVVSFHGGLPLPQPGEMKRLKARILVLHGADDPHVPPGEVAAWQAAMRQAGTDWQMIFFGGAVHSFSNPAAGSDKARGAAYDAPAARRSWRYLQSFFQEMFPVRARD
jgi:dienelactone hydrolase